MEFPKIPGQKVAFDSLKQENAKKNIFLKDMLSPGAIFRFGDQNLIVGLTGPRALFFSSVAYKTTWVKSMANINRCGPGFGVPRAV